MKRILITVFFFVSLGCLAQEPTLIYSGQAVRRELVVSGDYHCSASGPITFTSLPRTVTPLSLTTNTISPNLTSLYPCPGARFASATVSSLPLSGVIYRAGELTGAGGTLISPATTSHTATATAV